MRSLVSHIVIAAAFAFVIATILGFWHDDRPPIHPEPRTFAER